jgi:hypothetical protein
MVSDGCVEAGLFLPRRNLGRALALDSRYSRNELCSYMQNVFLAVTIGGIALLIGSFALVAAFGL